MSWFKSLTSQPTGRCVTELHRAIVADSVTEVATLLAASADLSAVDEEGRTSLHVAAYHNRVEAGKVLVAACTPSTAHAIDATGRTALQVASELNHRLLTSLLQGIVCSPSRPLRPPGEASDLFTPCCIQTYEQAMALSAGLASNTQLKALDLTGSEWGKAKGLSSLGTALCANHTLVTLNLSRCLHSAAETEALCAGLVKSVSLKTLVLYGSDGIGVSGFAHLAALLKDQPSLSSLNLSYSLRCAAEAEALAPGVASNSGLVDLDLSGSIFAARSRGPSGLRAICRALKINLTLGILLLRGAIASDDDAHELALALAEGCSLHTLDISDAPASDSGVRQVMSAVKHCPQLKNLKVNDYHVKAFQQTRKLLQAEEKLRCEDGAPIDLDVSGCLGDPAEAERFVTLLNAAGARPLLSLDLRDCTLRGRAVNQIADHLSASKTLSTLNLTGSLTADGDVAVVVAALGKNNSLRYLNLARCNVGPEAIVKLSIALRLNNSLTKLRGLPIEHMDQFLPLIELNEIASNPEPPPAGKAATVLHDCVRLGKPNLIPSLLALGGDYGFFDPTGGSLHSLLLKQNDVDRDALLSVFRGKWEVDAATADLLHLPDKFAAFSATAIELVEEDWRDKETGRTILHCIVDCCRLRNLEGSQAEELCTAILTLRPGLADVLDDSNQTPAEIAAHCANAPGVQKMFILGIINAMQRRGWELGTCRRALEIAKADLCAMRASRDAMYSEHDATVTALQEAAMVQHRENLLLRQENDHLISQLRGRSEVHKYTQTVVTSDEEVELELEELLYEGQTYWLDPGSGKVYNEKDAFVGFFDGVAVSIEQ